MAKKNKWDERIERMESFWTFLAKRRRTIIEKSMMRPLYQEVLKTLFLVGVLLVDSLIPLELYLEIAFPVNIIGTLLLLGFLLYAEIYVYNSVWGKKGRWSLEKYKEKENVSK